MAQAFQPTAEEVLGRCSASRARTVLTRCFNPRPRKSSAAAIEVLNLYGLRATFQPTAEEVLGRCRYGREQPDKSQRVSTHSRGSPRPLPYWETSGEVTVTSFNPQPRKSSAAAWAAILEVFTFGVDLDVRGLIGE